MGNCKSKSSVDANGLGPTKKLPPFTPSTDLFLELGVPLINRPTPDELLCLWHEHDLDHNDVLDVMELYIFLQAISSRWGDGSWGQAGDGTSTSNGGSSLRLSGSKPSHSLLGKNASVTWEEARAALWDTPVFGVPSPIVLLFQRAFKTRCTDGSTALTRVEASKLARQLLSSAHVPKKEAVMISKQLLDTTATKTGPQGNHVTLNDFVAICGPPYAELSPSHNAFVGLDDEPQGDLPLGTRIRSFAPVRDGTPVEILNCGEAIMSAMLNAVDNATTEIMMSWWEFCPDLPVVRSESLGANAWNNSNCTLPPLLKQKADKGVKVYILLWNIIDVVLPTAPMVEHAMESLGRLHPNITVISHPGLNIWTHTHHQKFMVVDRKVAIVGGLDLAFKRWDTPDHPLFDPKSAVHPGVDLFVSGVSSRKNVEQYFQNKRKDVVASRAEVPVAKPWQDVSLWLKGDAAADVAFNFIQRWNWVRQDTIEVFGDGLRNDMPEIPMQIRYLRRPTPGAEAVDDATRKTVAPGGLPSPNVLHKACKCQIIRSLGKWSGGTSPAEISHYEAWVSAISEAQDYIYIEQQYFISNMGEGDAKNRIAEVILLKAKQAIDNGKPFRIYIVIPTIVEVETVAYYTRRTLIQDGKNKGERCLMSRIGVLLKSAKAGSYWAGKEPDSMLSVCSMYSADKSSSGRWEVGGIFVHSKVLIVDDRIAVIGSANVNDRSFVGYSDSELGAILWDDGDGSIRDFRLRLWRQLLGLPDGNTDDLVAEPASETAFDVWSEAARDNLMLLSSVTRFTPRDSITSYSQFKSLVDEYAAKSLKEKAAAFDEPERLEGMQGQLVLFPTKFLGDQSKKTFLEKLTESSLLTKPQFL